MDSCLFQEHEYEEKHQQPHLGFELGVPPNKCTCLKRGSHVECCDAPMLTSHKMLFYFSYSLSLDEELRLVVPSENQTPDLLA